MPSRTHTVAACFGGLSFLLGTVLGPPSLRYFAAAWPIFFISLGVRFQEFQVMYPAAATRILLLSVGCSWLWVPYVHRYVHGGFLLALALVLHVCTWKTLARLHVGGEGR